MIINAAFVYMDHPCTLWCMALGFIQWIYTDNKNLFFESSNMFSFKCLSRLVGTYWKFLFLNIVHSSVFKWKYQISSNNTGLFYQDFQRTALHSTEEVGGTAETVAILGWMGDGEETIAVTGWRGLRGKASLVIWSQAWWWFDAIDLQNINYASEEA